MKKLLLVPVLLLSALLVPSATAASADAPTAKAGTRPIIVKVEGDKRNGFHLTYADGSTIGPPTDSEAAAECSEYDTKVAVVRCNAEVRTWYRDLADLKRSLAWVRAHE